jgi:hypothetical protein
VLAAIMPRSANPPFRSHAERIMLANAARQNRAAVPPADSTTELTWIDLGA